MSEQFSLKDMRPLTLREKQLRLERKEHEIRQKRDVLSFQVNDINNALSELNKEVRGKEILPERYKEICDLQTEYTAKKRSIEQQIMPVKKELRDVNYEIQEIKIQIDKVPSDKAMEIVVSLRDKYLSFAADTTRVSSMRAMASKFVEEIQSLIPHLPK